jgi:hypothetical protein
MSHRSFKSRPGPLGKQPGTLFGPYVSLFKDAKATKPEGDPLALDKVFGRIATRQLPKQKEIRQLRAQIELNGATKELEKKIHRLKESLPGVTLSATFAPTRANKNLVQHSGVLQIDIDDVKEKEIPTIKQQLVASPYMIAVWLSVSGKLKAAIRITNDPAQQKDSFRAAKVYIKDLTGKDIDEQCKDVARLCFLSYDPDIWHRPFEEALILPLLPTEKRKKAGVDAAAATELMQEIAKRLAEFQPDDVQWTISLAYATRRADSIQAAKEILLNALTTRRGSGNELRINRIKIGDPIK